MPNRSSDNQRVDPETLTRRWLNDPNSLARRLIRRKARELRNRTPHEESDDVEQSLAAALCERARSFDPQRGDEACFIKVVIETQAASLIRKQVAAKRGHGQTTVSLEDAVNWENAGAGSPNGSCGARQETEGTELRMDISLVINGLPHELREVAETLKRMPKRDTGRRLGKSRRALDSDVARLQKTFESAGLRDYLRNRGQR